ncbi:MAG TPA: hypothetical protein VI997_01960, partial [Candidatus Thermoplasmatota archaeon]|nr:hypothetical protein [Candidatus Thermoplasmatota archaeon]
MSRAGFVVAFLVALTPLAVAEGDADAEEAAAAAQAALEAAIAELEAELATADAEATLWGSVEAYDEETSQPDETEPTADDEDEAAEAPPTYREDALLAPWVDASPVPIRPVAKAITSVPLAGGVLGDAFRTLGLGDEAAAADSVGAGPASLAPAAAAPPAPPAPSQVAEGAAVALVAVGVAGVAAGATSIGAPLLEKFRRVAGVLGITLYTRLARQDLLDHDVRD